MVLENDKDVPTVREEDSSNGLNEEATKLGIYYNKDSERRAKYNDQFQCRILKEYCRIINIPSQLRRSDVQELIREILVLIRYDNHEDRFPITWPIPIGKTNNTFSMRVKMSYEFWTWYKRTGYRHLNELNTKNNWNIRLIQEKSLFNKDKENLCLYVRNKFKQLYQGHGKEPISMKIKRDQIQLENLGTFDPIVLGKRLNIDFEDWHGTSLDVLIDDKIRKAGGLKHLGPLKLPGLGAEDIHEVYLGRKYNAQETV